MRPRIWIPLCGLLAACAVDNESQTADSGAVGRDVGPIGQPDATGLPPDSSPPEVDAAPEGDGALGPDRGVSDAGHGDGPPADTGSPDAAPPDRCEPGQMRSCVECPAGRQLCDRGRWGPCVGSTDLCDGLDNDCDGEIDEGYTVGEPCTIGVGGCAAEDVWVCDEDGMGVHCPAVPGGPVGESCDGIDNDCDGAVDEGFELGVACMGGEGECVAAGERACGPEGLVICDAPPGDPSPELCDGLDNDCDGEIDEDFEIGGPCSVGVGACSRDGLIACEPEGGAACDALPGDPIDELCNGIDDDCDGMIDEGFDLGAVCAAGMGACRNDGVLICSPEGVAVCSVMPGAPEICDGIDNDCDGEIDEGFALGAPCTAGVGPCTRDGVNQCDALGGVACSAEPGPPAAEICDQIDNDCNGRIDDAPECLPPHCFEYRELNEANRNAAFNDGAGGVTICDQDGWQAGWYRFTGEAGVRMPNAAPALYACGTHAPGWLEGAYPGPGEAVQRRVCFNWSGDPCNWNAAVEVQECGGYFVFNLPRTPVCSLRYCGEDGP